MLCNEYTFSPKIDDYATNPCTEVHINVYIYIRRLVVIIVVQHSTYLVNVVAESVI